MLFLFCSELDDQRIGGSVADEVITFVGRDRSIRVKEPGAWIWKLTVIYCPVYGCI